MITLTLTGPAAADLIAFLQDNEQDIAENDDRMRRVFVEVFGRAPHDGLPDLVDIEILTGRAILKSEHEHHPDPDPGDPAPPRYNTLVVDKHARDREYFLAPEGWDLPPGWRQTHFVDGVSVYRDDGMLKEKFWGLPEVPA